MARTSSNELARSGQFAALAARERRTKRTKAAKPVVLGVSGATIALVVGGVGIRRFRRRG